VRRQHGEEAFFLFARSQRQPAVANEVHADRGRLGYQCMNRFGRVGKSRQDGHGHHAGGKAQGACEPKQAPTFVKRCRARLEDLTLSLVRDGDAEREHGARLGVDGGEHVEIAFHQGGLGQHVHGRARVTAELEQAARQPIPFFRWLVRVAHATSDEQKAGLAHASDFVLGKLDGVAFDLDVPVELTGRRRRRVGARSWRRPRGSASRAASWDCRTTARLHLLPRTEDCDGQKNRRAIRHLPRTTIASFCTDLNRNLASAKEHEPELAAVGAGKDFQAKLEAICAPSRPTVAPKKPPSPACPTTTAPAKPKVASTSS
jgi:hypothetical protein